VQSVGVPRSVANRGSDRLNSNKTSGDGYSTSAQKRFDDEVIQLHEKPRQVQNAAHSDAARVELVHAANRSSSHVSMSAHLDTR
jgi:hypothetical protein